MMNILKIGSLNFPKNRWEDVFTVFDKMYVSCKLNEKENSEFAYFKFNNETFINKIFIKITEKMRYSKNMYTYEKTIFNIWRLFAYRYISMIKKLDFDYVHSSYNFFDDSAMLTILLKNAISNKSILRAYKETRPGFDFMEIYSIQLSDTIVLNTEETKQLLEEKYGKKLFANKKVIIGPDEDYRKDSTINNVKLCEKLSKYDGRPHIVILAGECNSDCVNTLLGSRQFYIPLIEQFISEGFVVHIHTLKITPDINGIDQYEVIKEKYPDQLFIENGLNFEHDTDNAYFTLSRYDYGVLHNLNLGDGVSEFDKINISHRFYEYEIAHVAPIVEKNTTIVEERIIEENRCGYVYQKANELKIHLTDNYNFLKPSFKDYIHLLYNKL